MLPVGSHVVREQVWCERPADRGAGAVRKRAIVASPSATYHLFAAPHQERPFRVHLALVRGIPVGAAPTPRCSGTVTGEPLPVIVRAVQIYGVSDEWVHLTVLPPHFCKVGAHQRGADLAVVCAPGRR